MIAGSVENAVIEIERRIRAAHPEVVTLFVKPQTPAAYRDTVRLRFGEAETDVRSSAAPIINPVNAFI